MPTINPWDQDAYSLRELTRGINKLPILYGQVRGLNIFQERPVRTRNIFVDERNGVLTLLPALPVGAPSTIDKRETRAARTFRVPHFPLEYPILPEEYEGVRAFATENQFDPLADVVARTQQRMKNKHDITLEWLQMGALKGIIADGNGNLIYNLFTEYAIVQQAVDFDLGNPASDVPAHCRAV